MSFVRLRYAYQLSARPIMLLRNKTLLACLCLLFLSFVTLLAHLSSRRSGSSTQWIPPLKGQPVEPCPDKRDWLAGLDLTYPIRYAHRDIIVNPVADLKRASLTKLDGPLFPDFQTIDVSDDSKVDLHLCEKPLVLDVPAVAQQSGNASHVVFGISTTLKRLDNSITQLLRWLPHTHARLFIVVIEKEQVGEAEGMERADAVAADPTEKDELQARMRSLGMDVTLVEPMGLQDMFSEKYFSLIKIMYDNRNDNTLWMGLLDDDTFIPSMPALLTMLAQYDAHEQYYVGGLSESWWSVTHYGMMGFGGAGIYLSIALAEVMVSNYDRCKDTSYANAGDIRVLECIYITTETKLTNERDLHQIDVHGDLSGIYESGRMPLSLHHWKTGGVDDKGYNLPSMSLVTNVCGTCFLQRWQFGRDLVLSNGFSISIYPKGNLKGANMEQMEETWNQPPIVEGSNNRGVDHSLAPIRPKLILDDEKIQYRLVNTAVVEGGVRQSYLHTGLGEDIDSLLELFWMEGMTVDARDIEASQGGNV
jgi:hypothetical protein